MACPSVFDAADLDRRRPSGIVTIATHRPSRPLRNRLPSLCALICTAIVRPQASLERLDGDEPHAPDLRPRQIPAQQPSLDLDGLLAQQGRDLGDGVGEAVLRHSIPMTVTSASVFAAAPTYPDRAAATMSAPVTRR